MHSDRTTTPFENIDLCLNRACIALAILIFNALLHLFMTNKGIHTEIADRHITKGRSKLLGLQYQLMPVVRAQSTSYWQC